MMIHVCIIYINNIFYLHTDKHLSPPFSLYQPYPINQPNCASTPLLTTNPYPIFIAVGPFHKEFCTMPREAASFASRYDKYLLDFQRNGHLSLGPMNRKTAQSVVVGIYHYRDALVRQMKREGFAAEETIGPLMEIYDNLYVSRDEVPGSDGMFMVNLNKVPEDLAVQIDEEQAKALSAALKVTLEHAKAGLGMLTAMGWEVRRKPEQLGES